MSISDSFKSNQDAAVQPAAGAPMTQKVICDWTNRPYTVRGSAPQEAERFIVSRYDDRVEICWEYTDYEKWAQGQPTKVSGTEQLPADYFSSHTLEEFISFLDDQPWGWVFVYEVKRDPRIGSLFPQN